MPEAPGNRASVTRGRAWILVSPLALIAVCHLTQRVAGQVLGDHAVLPTLFVFWVSIAAIVWMSVGSEGVRRWFGPSRGRLGWGVLALLVGLLSLPNFIEHRNLLQVPAVLLPWLVFALVNPWFEEAYWRGLLMDATGDWGALWSICYSAFWFALSHPLIWGVHTPGMWKLEVVIALFVVGALWGLVYRRTGSLRWTVAGHMCANLLGLAAPVLLNVVPVR